MSEKPGGKKEKPLTYRQRASIQFVEQDEPAFIQAIKKRIGFREPAKLEDKFDDEADTSGARGDEEDDDIRNLREEERPQIVVMDPAKDISSEQLEKEITKKNKEDDQKKIDEGRILFRKPVKRPADDSKTKAGEEDTNKQQRGAVSAKKNTNLLSFADDDE